MPLAFQCQNCGGRVLTFLRRGESGRCKSCGTLYVVPDNAEDADVGELLFAEGAAANPEYNSTRTTQSKAKPRRDLRWLVIVAAILMAHPLGKALGISYSPDAKFVPGPFLLYWGYLIGVILLVEGIWRLITGKKDASEEPQRDAASRSDAYTAILPSLALCAAGMALLAEAILAGVGLFTNLVPLTYRAVEGVLGTVVGLAFAAQLLGESQRKAKAWSDVRAWWAAAVIVFFFMLRYLTLRSSAPTPPPHSMPGSELVDAYILLIGGAWVLSHGLFRLHLRRGAGNTLPEGGGVHST
jgi:hypothetical protein